ncbi:hypothetical protein RM530_17940 [Algiphilus sp. W345]|uniref:Lipoprotein n=1 Tax=Banduia mediterranea TaxID=3075609 RepID=A0ABU2WNV4_9GAMM|nr:hypothetical protein [Algiphilus sp. W345]MDT0499228.1 hypothetical protein [Algiphilus sp. W345]
MRYMVVLSLLLMACGQAPSGADRAAAMLKVYKHDGAVQCQSKGEEAAVMARQLTDQGIAVQCAQKARDGRMHSMVCGRPSDSINVFAIRAEDLDKAESLGFDSVDTLDGYSDQACTP